MRPDLRIERWLHAVDDRVLTRSGRARTGFDRSPHAVQEFFELSYLLVYLAVPAGAATVIVSGHAEHVDGFWTIVLLAEFVVLRHAAVAADAAAARHSNQEMAHECARRTASESSPGESGQHSGEHLTERTCRWRIRDGACRRCRSRTNSRGGVSRCSRSASQSPLWSGDITMSWIPYLVRWWLLLSG